MTPDQMAELAARLRKLAQAYRSVVVVDVTSINEATDLERAADLIEQMAQAEPIATVYYPRTGGNVGVSWRAIPETGAMPPEGAKLYLAPPAQRVPLSDEQIDKALQTAPHAILVLADRSHLTSAAFKDVLRRLARTIEQAHGIRSE